MTDRYMQLQSFIYVQSTNVTKSNPNDDALQSQSSGGVQ